MSNFNVESDMKHSKTMKSQFIQNNSQLSMMQTIQQLNQKVNGLEMEV